MVRKQTVSSDVISLMVGEYFDKLAIHHVNSLQFCKHQNVSTINPVYTFDMLVSQARTDVSEFDTCEP